MKGTIISIPCISLRARRICLFSRLEGYNKRPRRAVSLNPPTQEEKKKRNACLTKRRIYDAVHVLRDSALPKTIYNRKYNSRFICFLTFVTLTLPEQQKGTDRETHYQVFAPFMRQLKKLLPNLLYIWRAETQSNGNLHYHLITNQFIHYRDLRNLWNIALYRAGYQQHQDPNSTDIHSLKAVRDEAAYIAKYISKTEEGRREVTIKKWDYCDELKRVKPITIEAPSESIYNELRTLIKQGGKMNIYDYVTVIEYKKNQLQNLSQLSNLLHQFLSQLNINPPPLEFVVN